MSEAVDTGARLAFLELAVPRLREQRDAALDDVVRAKAEHQMHAEALMREITRLEGALKAAQEPKNRASQPSPIADAAAALDE